MTVPLRQLMLYTEVWYQTEVKPFEMPLPGSRSWNFEYIAPNIAPELMMSTILDTEAKCSSSAR